MATMIDRKRPNGMAEDSNSPTKKTKFMDDALSDSGDEEATLGINEEYARRFEHNKKRTELQQLEEKYGKSNGKEEEVEDSESSSDESEDDVGEFVTEDLNAEISATINAIRSKDPRVYDFNEKFYSEFEPTEEGTESTKEEKGRPMFLKDYHRKNLLEGVARQAEDTDAPKTYVQEQAALKDDVVKAMHAEGDASSEDDENGFLVRKTPKEPVSTAATTLLDPAMADREPETFLSNFLSSRAWIPDATSNFQPLESDDEEEDQKAEDWEAAYNLRFENPELANQKLMSHARDAAAKYSVRREEKSRRKHQREKDRQKKEEEKKKRETERSRLKKLRMEQMEQKVERIREAAGLSGKTVDIKEWATVLDEDWDDSKFDDEMRKRFGEDYYMQEGGSEEEASHSRRKKSKKPKWDDDIDIKDLIPDFEDDEEPGPALAFSDDEDEAADVEMHDDVREEPQHKIQKNDRADAKATARRNRRLIEALVDQSLPLDTASSSSKSFTPFRYRETSPNSFGLTPLDILAADDAALNEFAGLKKLAAFRDTDRKKKDKKKLGKKARLREWRKETFGNEEGPKQEVLFAPSDKITKHANEENDDGVREGERRRKRKRSKKGKDGGVALP